MIQIPTSEPLANPAGPDGLTTTILVRRLPIEFYQTQIIVVIRQLLCAKMSLQLLLNEPKMTPLDAMMEWLQLDASTLWFTYTGVIAALSYY